MVPRYEFGKIAQPVGRIDDGHGVFPLIKSLEIRFGFNGIVASLGNPGGAWR
jgi:hypothetical protein